MSKFISRSNIINQSYNFLINNCIFILARHLFILANVIKYFKGYIYFIGHLAINSSFSILYKLKEFDKFLGKLLK